MHEADTRTNKIEIQYLHIIYIQPEKIKLINILDARDRTIEQQAKEIAELKAEVDHLNIKVAMYAH